MASKKNAQNLVARIPANELPKVLFVDDDPDIIDLLVFSLDAYCDIRSRVAISGLHALQTLNRERFDLVVSDFQMPGMVGTDLLLLASERWPEMRRILFTAHTTGDMIIECGDYVDQVLDKALDPELICESICRHAKTKRTR